MICVSHFPLEWNEKEFKDLIKDFGETEKCFLVRKSFKISKNFFFYSKNAQNRSDCRKLVPEAFTWVDTRAVFDAHVVILNLKDNDMGAKNCPSFNSNECNCDLRPISDNFQRPPSFKTWNFDKELVFGVQLDGIWIFGIYFEILGNKGSKWTSRIRIHLSRWQKISNTR